MKGTNNKEKKEFVDEKMSYNFIVLETIEDFKKYTRK